MAQKSTMRPPKGGNIKKGICENHQYLNPDNGETGDCPKCASGEVQSVNVQRLSDFHCSVCGAKLVPVKESFMQKNKKLVIALAVVAVAVGGFGIWSVTQKGDSETTSKPEKIDIVETPQTEKPDTVSPVIEDSKTEPVKDAEEDNNVQSEESVQPVQVTQSTVLGGAARLVKENGYTNIVFLRDYSLDLGKSDGRKLHIRKGETIEHADIRHNVLRGGDYINSNKEENTLSGLNVKL